MKITEKNWNEKLGEINGKCSETYQAHSYGVHCQMCVIEVVNSLITSIKQEEREKSIRGFSQWWATSQTREKERYIQIEAHQEAMRMANIYIQSLKEEDGKEEGK